MKNRCSLWLWPRASRTRDAFLGRGQTREGYGEREGEGGWYPRAIKILRLCKFHVVETQRKINRGSSSAFSLSRPFYSPCLARCIYNTARFRILPSTSASVYTWRRKKYRRNESRNKSTRVCKTFSFFFSFCLLCDQVLRVMCFRFTFVTRSVRCIDKLDGEIKELNWFRRNEI